MTRQNSAARTTSARTASARGACPPSTFMIDIQRGQARPGHPGAARHEGRNACQHSRLRDPRRRGRSGVQRFLHRRGRGRGHRGRLRRAHLLDGRAGPAQRHSPLLPGKGLARARIWKSTWAWAQGFGLRSIDPVTEAYLDEDSVLEMDTSQIGGVDTHQAQSPGARWAKTRKLLIRERLFTEKEQNRPDGL